MNQGHREAISVACFLAMGSAALLARAAQAAEQPTVGPRPPSEVVVSDDGGAMVTYDLAFFAQFNAITADDLLRRIPGIQDLLDGQATGGGGPQQGGRGFGSSGAPILFNGRRLSGKTNDPLDALQRIQARQVVRIEVITGSVPGLDIRIGNEGTVVNVVLESTLATGYGAWEGSAHYFTGGPWRGGGKLSYAGDFGPLSYILAAEIAPRFNTRYTRDDYVLPPNPSPFGHIILFNGTRGTDVTGTATLTYGFVNGDTANLNIRYADEPRITRQPTDSYTILAGGSERYTGTTLLLQDFDGDVELEIGGDYEHAFESGDSLRALFVATSDKRPQETDFFSTPAGAPQIQTLRQVIQSDRSERILRGYYNWAITAGHSLEVGGEAAFNTLDQVNRRFDNIGGVLTPVALFNSDAKVEETRFESFTRYSWQVSPKLYMEAALDTEYSRLNQEGTDVSTSRSFFFPKPRLDLRYDVDQRIQFRGRILRTISQLDFANFVSSISTSDVRIGVIQAGNPNLVPEKTWTFEATGQYRLPSDQGVVSLRAFYNDIRDAIDKILIVPDVAGSGNIGDAHSYGAELKVGLRLDGLGLTGASIDASGTLQDSIARDAFTGEMRPIQNFQNYTWSVSFRHDTEWNNLAYGATFTGSDRRYGSDIDYTHWFKFKPSAEAFVEMRAAGLTFRIEGDGLFQVVTRDRLQYVGNRAAGNLRRLELRYDTFDTIFRFIVKGTF